MTSSVMLRCINVRLKSVIDYVDYADINTLDQLRSMPEWSESNPLRVVTGYQNVARKFFQEKGFEHVVLLSADGALEAAPLMGSADIILDLVSTGTVIFDLVSIDILTVFNLLKPELSSLSQDMYSHHHYTNIILCFVSTCYCQNVHILDQVSC